MFCLYMMQKVCRYDIFDFIVIIKVLIRQLMDTILKLRPFSLDFMYHSPCYITIFPSCILIFPKFSTSDL